MAVVLDGRECVLRREWPVDRSDIQQSTVGRRFPFDVFRNIGEGHERLTLRERWKRPFGKTENAKPCHCQASLENLSPGVLIRHVMALDCDCVARGEGWIRRPTHQPQLI